MILYSLLCVINICKYDATIRCPAEIPCDMFSPATVRIDFGASECFKVESTYRGNCSRVKSVTWCRQSQTPEPPPEPSTSNNVNTISWYYFTHFTWVDVAVGAFVLFVYLWIKIGQNYRVIRKPARLYIYRKRRVNNPDNNDDTTSNVPNTNDDPNVDNVLSDANDDFEENEPDSDDDFLGQHDFEENEQVSSNDYPLRYDLTERYDF